MMHGQKNIKKDKLYFIDEEFRKDTILKLHY